MEATVKLYQNSILSKYRREFRLACQQARCVFITIISAGQCTSGLSWMNPRMPLGLQRSKTKGIHQPLGQKRQTHAVMAALVAAIARGTLPPLMAGTMAGHDENLTAHAAMRAGASAQMQTGDAVASVVIPVGSACRAIAFAFVGLIKPSAGSGRCCIAGFLCASVPRW